MILSGEVLHWPVTLHASWLVALAKGISDVYIAIVKQCFGIGEGFRFSDLFLKRDFLD